MSPSIPPIVSRTPVHEQAEQLLGSLRQRRKELGERIDEMVGWSEAKEAASTEYASLSDEIRQVRTSLAAHRLKHLEATRRAFREPRRDASKRALTIIGDLVRTVDEIDVMSAELRRLGGAHRDLEASKILAYLTLPLEKLAREPKERHDC